MYEAEISKLQGSRVTLDSQIMALESSSINIQTFNVLKQSTNPMKQMRGTLDADAIEDIMDDIQEEKDTHDAIAEAISRPALDMFDDDEWLNELAELDNLELDVSEDKQVLPNVPTHIPKPTSVTVPNKSVNKLSKEDERSLKELESSMLA